MAWNWSRQVLWRGFQISGWVSMMLAAPRKNQPLPAQKLALGQCNCAAVADVCCGHGSSLLFLKVMITLASNPDPEEEISGVRGWTWCPLLSFYQADVHELKACLQMVWSWSPPLVLPLSCETVLKGLPLLLSTSACSEGYFCSGENRGMKFPIFFLPKSCFPLMLHL